jgi:undecaprenyl-diphosphatase
LLESLDHSLFSALNRGAANGFLDWLMPRITNLHKEEWFAAMVLLTCGWFIWRGPRRARLWILCAAVSIGISDLAARRVVKEVIPRERPCHMVGAQMSYPNTRLVPGEECPGSPSFPSNHAANMAAVAAIGLWFTRRKIRWFWLLIPLIIGYSRIYLGYHYPLDVLGGWVMGSLMGGGVLWTLKGMLLSPIVNAVSVVVSGAETQDCGS